MKPFCLLPKGLWLRPGKGVNEISVGQQTALPVTERRTVLQPELFKSNLDGGEDIILECSPDTNVLGTEEDEDHQAAGDSQALARTSHVSGPMTWMGAVLPLIQT